MSGYIGSKASVTLVDGYTQAEADAEFVQDPNGAVTVDGSGNVGIGTSSPQATAEISGGLDNRLRINSTDGTTSNNYGVDFSTAGTVRSGIRYNAGNNYLAFYGFNNTERMRIDSAGRVTTPYQPIVNCGISDHNTSVAHAGSGVSALYTTGHPSVVVQGGMIVSSDRVTVPVAGKYLVSARQMNQSNGGEYFNILLNGTSVGYGYNSDTVYLQDMNADVILSCSASDYIQISYNTATTNRWESGHSNLMIYLIG